MGKVLSDEDEEALLEMEEWMEMSDEDQKALHEIEMKIFEQWVNSMTPLELYRYRRRLRVDLCRSNRRFAKQFGTSDSFWVHRLKDTQKMLVAARSEYYHGTEIGNG